MFKNRKDVEKKKKISKNKRILTTRAECLANKLNHHVEHLQSRLCSRFTRINQEYVQMYEQIRILPLYITTDYTSYNILIYTLIQLRTLHKEVQRLNHEEV